MVLCLFIHYGVGTELIAIIKILFMQYDQVDLGFMHVYIVLKIKYAHY